jgi:hypothetical protein
MPLAATLPAIVNGGKGGTLPTPDNDAMSFRHAELALLPQSKVTEVMPSARFANPL